MRLSPYNSCCCTRLRGAHLSREVRPGAGRSSSAPERLAGVLLSRREPTCLRKAGLRESRLLSGCCLPRDRLRCSLAHSGAPARPGDGMRRHQSTSDCGRVTESLTDSRADVPASEHNYRDLRRSSCISGKSTSWDLPGTASHPLSKCLVKIRAGEGLRRFPEQRGLEGGPITASFTWYALLLPQHIVAGKSHAPSRRNRRPHRRFAPKRGKTSRPRTLSNHFGIGGVTPYRGSPTNWTSRDAGCSSAVTGKCAQSAWTSARGALQQFRNTTASGGALMASSLVAGRAACPTG